MLTPREDIMAKLKRGDRVLIIAGLVIAIVAALGVAASALSDAAPASDLLVVCQTTDGFYRVDALSDEVTYTVTTTHGDEQGYNVVAIAHGTVDVTEADCSNQVCVEHDPISHEGEQIVCLPHGMVVEVVANEADVSALVS